MIPQKRAVQFHSQRPTEEELKSDYGYVPCRDERCNRIGVHPKHALREETQTRAGTPWTCPRCLILNRAHRRACKKCNRVNKGKIQ